MKRELMYVEAGLSALSLLVWFVLPIFSFVLIIPLFSILGWNMAFTINQILLIPMALALLMLIAALVNNRPLMIIAGVLQLIMFILTIVLRKDLLLGGNIRWIYTSAKLLLDKAKDAAGFQFGADDLNAAITFIIDNYMQIGIGLILHGICVVAYLLIAGVAPAKAKSVYQSAGSAGNGTASVQQPASSRIPSQQNTGYKHRT